jgi:hypothetical protein
VSTHGRMTPGSRREACIEPCQCHPRDQSSHTLGGNQRHLLWSVKPCVAAQPLPQNKQRKHVLEVERGFHSPRVLLQAE